MSIENIRMENKTDINSGSPIKETKHTPRYVAARIAAIGSMILSSCGIKVSSSSQEIDSSQSTPPKVNVENIPVSNLETSIPAPVPTEQGEKVEIFSADYPTTPDNFILTDTRTNKEKTELIKSWAPDDYEKEVALYKAEIERMGKRVEDFEFVSSVLEGKSWVVVPKSKKTGRMLVPKIGDQIQRSLDLWSNLNRTDDFFDLVEVNIDNPILIADETGWHVITDSQYSQWYDAEHDQIKTITPKLETTEKQINETKFIINPTFPIIQLNETYNADEYSSVLMEDFINGNILKSELEFLEKNNPFTEEVIPTNSLYTTSYEISSRMFGWSLSVDHVIFRTKPEYKNSNARPIKFLSFYKIIDQDLFQKIGFNDYERISSNQEKQPNLWIASWAYKNPDDTTTIGHTLIDLDQYNHFKTVLRKEVGDLDLMFVPGYKITNMVLSEDDYRNTLNLWFNTNKIYELYPELDPEYYAKIWLEGKIMPSELQKKLFTLQTVIINW